LFQIDAHNNIKPIFFIIYRIVSQILNPHTERIGISLYRETHRNITIRKSQREIIVSD